MAANKIYLRNTPKILPFKSLYVDVFSVSAKVGMETEENVTFVPQSMLGAKLYLNNGA